MFEGAGAEDRAVKKNSERQKAREIAGFEKSSPEDESSGEELILRRAEAEWTKLELSQQKVRGADLTARLRQRDEWIQTIRRSVAWKLVKPIWKLQEHLRKQRSDAGRGERGGELVFAVDTPQVTTSPRKSLHFTGWCCSHGGPEVAGVRARVDGKSYFARYGLSRDKSDPRVLDYPAASYSGFSVTIPAAKTAASIFLEAITPGGPWQCFFSYSTIAAGQGNEVSPAAREQNFEAVDLYPSNEVEDVIKVLRPLIGQHLSRITSNAPFLSIITPFSIFQPRWIAEAGASLLKQTFPDWEWCILTPPLLETTPRQLLEQIAELHGRVRLLAPQSSNASEAINGALESATGEVVCFLDLSDLLHSEALAAVMDKLREGYDILYSDEDKFDEKTGRRSEAFFKPDWSPEYLRGTMYFGPGLNVRRDLARRVRFNPDYAGIPYFEFILRATETGARVGHISKVLRHCRKQKDVEARDGSNTQIGARELQERAVNRQLGRLGLSARAEMAPVPLRLNMVPAARAIPLVSVIIPTKDSAFLLSSCLKSIYRNTSYPAFETILIDNNTSDAEALAVMEEFPLNRVHLPDPFNFSVANNLAVKHARGEYVVFLNNDTEVVSSNWLDHLLYYAEQSDVGATGALLLHDNGTVQHAGVILGMGGTADHAMRGFSAGSDGYWGTLSCAREVSGVTAACMMMRKALFQELGGFDEGFSTMYQDVDLCLRLRERGLRIIWTPQALLLHHESVSRTKYYDKNDRRRLLERWQQVIERGDPYYNPNLNLERGDYSPHSRA